MTGAMSPVLDSGLSNIAIVSARTLESMKLDMKELYSHLSPGVRLL